MKTKVLAINGSARMGKGHTEVLLSSFLEGMQDGGAECERICSQRLEIKPCTAELYCWFKKPGQCHIKDDMQSLYPKLRSADILVLAIPMYIPLPGKMQIFINRLCPLTEPILEIRAGRTRARFHEDVKIGKIVLLATGGWWEKGNTDTLVRIVRELTEDVNVEFAGALLRPHAFMMKHQGEVTEQGREVLEAAGKAGRQLIEQGKMSQEFLEAVSRPLISFEELVRKQNKLYLAVKKRQ